MNEEGAKSGNPGALAESEDEPVAGDYFPRRLIWLARICLLVALCGAGYLASVALKGGPVAGCGPGSGCDRVLSSHWAYWLGVPVSLPAIAVYLSLLAATVTVSRQRSSGMQLASLHLIITLSLLVLASALWFLLVQRLAIHAWCKFCLATHVSAGWAACLLLAAALKRGPKGHSAGSVAVSRRRVGLSVGAAIVGLAILVAGQMAVKKRLYAVTYFSRQSEGTSTQVLLHDGRFRLDPKELPVMGSSTATNFIVSFFDYTCSHCRALHPLLKAAEEKYAGRLGIITLPVPLDADCNPLILFTAPANQNACEYAKLGLAVWHARPEAFREFDDWLFDSPEIPALGEARTHAAMLVGQEALDSALTNAWVNRQLQTDIALYQANAREVGDGLLPQLVIGDVVTHGAIETQDQLTQLIETHMFTSPAHATGQ
jgi:uncharacterized membrane protein/protein-disulfide isomerase